jgi:hypothetical protein
MRVAVALLAAALVATAAVAKLPTGWNSVGGYMAAHIQKGSADEGLLLLYLEGIGTGFLTANAELEKSPLYCQPDIALIGENYKLILDDELKDMARNTDAHVTIPVTGLKDVPIAMVLLYGLQRKFPCPRK